MSAAADQFEVELSWSGQEPLIPGRRYRLVLGTGSLDAAFAQPKYRLDPDTARQLAARTLGPGETGVAVMTAERPIELESPGAGGSAATLTVIDPRTGVQVATGRLRFALRRSQNVRWQRVDVDKQARAAMNAHQPAAVWFTGLSGAGKSEIANRVEQGLHAEGVRTYLLDGDNVRHGLNKDLGFTEADRIENLRRIAEVTKLMVDAGLIVLVAFISPFRDERRRARELLAPGEFCEVYVDTPLEIAEARDVKGLYAKARRGELLNFTGIDSPYEPPEAAEVHIRTTDVSPVRAAELVIEQLRRMSVL